MMCVSVTAAVASPTLNDGPTRKGAGRCSSSHASVEAICRSNVRSMWDLACRARDRRILYHARMPSRQGPRLPPLRAVPGAASVLRGAATTARATHDRAESPKWLGYPIGVRRRPSRVSAPFLVAPAPAWSRNRRRWRHADRTSHHSSASPRPRDGRKGCRTARRRGLSLSRPEHVLLLATRKLTGHAAAPLTEDGKAIKFLSRLLSAQDRDSARIQ
jgi:hypothetical protein